MIHLESYKGKPAADWNVGLCEESDQQFTFLRRMRFKIATKILFLDEQTRISTIVNDIKNMDERDPPKTKGN